jgi:hypothetical protein
MVLKSQREGAGVIASRGSGVAAQSDDMRRKKTKWPRRSARTRRPRPIFALAVLLLLSPVRSVVAQPSAAGCASPQVRIGAPLSSVWAERVRLLCLGLVHRGDLDPAARLEIVPAASDGLELHASLPDGRSAMRRVDTAEALIFTAEALLVLPPSPPPSAAATGPDRPAESAPTALAESAPAPPDALSGRTVAADQNAASTIQPAFVETPLHLMLQMSVIGHLSGVPAVVGGGLALHAAVRFRKLFLEVAPRWEAQTASLRMGLSDFEMHTLGVAVLAGLRVWASGSGASDIGAGVLIASESQTYRPVSKEVGGSLIAGEFTAFARLLWGVGRVRWVVSSDLTLVPSRLSHPTHIRDIFPALPVFGFGFGFGVHWESS